MTNIRPTDIRLGTPVIEPGENRYLRHYIYEIFDRGCFAGHLFATRYAYQDAANDQILRAWMSRPDTYMDHNQKFMLEPTSRFASLPVALAESLKKDTGMMIYLDEVTLSPEFRNQGIEEIAIQRFVDTMSADYDGIIVPDYSAMARYIKGIHITPSSFWSKLGFKVIEDRYLVSEGSIVNATNDSERHHQNSDR